MVQRVAYNQFQFALGFAYFNGEWDYHVTLISRDHRHLKQLFFNYTALYSFFIYIYSLKKLSFFVFTCLLFVVFE